MRRPASPRRSTSIRLSADGGVIEIRAGDKVLGEVSRLQSQTEGAMTGAFTHRPAYADFAPEMLKLTRALAASRLDEADALRAALEAAGLEVWHTSHEMRIDRPRSLSVSDGTATFSPNDAFLMMRTGGLG
ncbi:MAG: hypothetical protein SFW09_14460 [Hyphomicrobiaceae bacterium]|nr:hypothetical protein [Hyphomicrobiaceae bacterium]